MDGENGGGGAGAVRGKRRRRKCASGRDGGGGGGGRRGGRDGGRGVVKLAVTAAVGLVIVGIAGGGFPGVRGEGLGANTGPSRTGYSKERVRELR